MMHYEVREITKFRVTEIDESGCTIDYWDFKTLKGAQAFRQNMEEEQQ